MKKYFVSLLILSFLLPSMTNAAAPAAEELTSLIAYLQKVVADLTAQLSMRGQTAQISDVFAPASTFAVGGRVQTTATVNVRSSAGTKGKLKGTQPTGATGTISSGPKTASGYKWWNVNFDSGPDGWVAETYLTPIAQPLDTNPPTVSITSPVSGTSITTAQTLTIQASASDNTAVSKVEFYDGTTLKGTDTTAPYSYDWSISTTDNGTHSLSAKAYDTSNNSQVSSAISLTVNIPPPVTVPSAPTNLTATPATCSSITLSWTDNSDNESGFEVWQYTASRATWIRVGTTGANVVTYTNSALNPSTTYSYYVRSYNTAGFSAASSATAAVTPACADTQAPTVPTNFAGAAISSTQINLSWTASTDNVSVSGYRLSRNGTLIITTPSTSYQDTGLAANTTYNYSVVAYDPSGNISSAAIASATTQPSPSTAFQINDRVQATATINVRGIPSLAGTLLGTQPLGALGTVIGGPTYADGYFWWNINFDSGVDGWSVENYLTKYTADTTLPSVSITSPASGTYTTAGTITISASASDNIAVSKVEFYDGATLKGTDTTSPYSYDWTFGTSDNGSHTFTAKAYDTSNNTQVSNAVTLSVAIPVADTTPPSTPTLSGSATSCTTVTLSWTQATDTGGSGLKGYNIYKNSAFLKLVLSPALAATDTVAANTISLYTETAIDNANNQSSLSNQISVTTPACADTTLPTVSLTSPTNGSTVSGTITLQASASDNIGVTKVDFLLDNNVIGTSLTTPYTLNYDTTLASNASHTFSAKAYDAAGNTNISSASVTVSNVVQTSAPFVKGFGGIYSDSGRVVANDAAGNIYIAGNFAGTASLGCPTPLTSAGGFDMFLAKYSPAGACQWSVRYGGTGNEQQITSISLDGSGNIYVGGYFSGTANFGGADLISAGASDIFLAKYSPQGAHMWSERFGGTYDDLLYGLAADTNGDVVISGSFKGAVNFGGATFNSVQTDVDSFVARYSAQGAHMWSKTFANSNGGVDRATAVVLDSNGNIFIAGFFQAQIDLGGGPLLSSSSSVDIYLAKFTSAGTFIWGKVRGGVNNQTASAMTVDQAGDVIVSGLLTTSADFGGGTMTAMPNSISDPFVVKYSGTDGSFQWAKVFGGVMDEAVNALKTDAQGNVVLTGHFNLANITVDNTTLINAGSYDVFVVKYSSGGSLIWAKSFGGSGTDEGTGIAIGPDLYPVITGYFNGTANFNGTSLTSAGFSDIFLVKLDNSVPPPPASTFVKGFGGVGNDAGQAVTTDSSGNIITAGYFSSTVDFGGGTLQSAGGVEDIFLAKHSPSGAYIWSKEFGGSGRDRATSVAVDKDGNILVAGYFSGTVDFGGGPLTSADLLDIFVAKYSPSGAHMWSKSFGGTGDDGCYGVAVDAAGNVFITGAFKSTVNFGSSTLTDFASSEFFLAKFSASGAHLWSRKATGNGIDFGLGLAIDANGDVVTTGSFNVAINFGGGILATAGGADVFLAKFSGADGSYVWAKRFGSTLGDQGTGVVVDSSNNIIVTGSFSGTVDFSGGTGSPISTSAGLTDAFLAEYSASGAHIWSKRLGADTAYGNALTVDASRNVIVTGLFQGTANFDGQSFTSAGTSDAFISKYSSTGTHVWTQRFGGASPYGDAGYGITTDLSGNIIATGDFAATATFNGTTLVSPGTYDHDIFLIKLAP